MSRVGNLPITVPAGVEVEVNPSTIVVNGPKGKLSLKTLPLVKVSQVGNILKISRENETKEARSTHGLMRTLINNMVLGTTEGFEKELEFNGVGFRARVEGDNLILTMGFSHPVEISSPEGINFKVSENKITVSGFSKELVGMIAAKVRAVRPPEPYKGKGIKYIDEVIRRKAGKAGKATTAGSGGK